MPGAIRDVNLRMLLLLNHLRKRMATGNIPKPFTNVYFRRHLVRQT